MILGGGVGAVAAAFALTDGPNRGRYDVTIYQIGWRLGGKGASSRSGPASRIEEHGMHIWFGFYDNALDMMERCYDELGDRNDTFANAFVDHDYVVLEDLHQGTWTHFPMHFPRGTADAPPTPIEYLKVLLRWIRKDWRTRMDSMGEPPPAIDEALDLLERMAGEPAADTLGEYSAAIGRLQVAIEQAPAAPSNEVRWATMAYEIGAAAARGMALDRVLWRGFDVIDDRDLWTWLAHHGAPARQKDSVMMRGLYTQAFAFPEGDDKQRSMAAGSSLRAALRMLFGYRGAFMRKMRAGMGDIVFAPFYRVLKRRGVQFKFFHRVKALHVDPSDPSRIGMITLGRQLDLKPNGTPPDRPPSCCPTEPEYDPLFEVGDDSMGVRHCWRDAPDEAQIVEADVAKIQAMKADPAQYFNLESAWTSWDEEFERDCTLKHKEHFDHVVLAISVGALDRICAELAQRNADWQRMLQTTVTVRTQAAQLWLYPPLPELGWTEPEPVHGAYAFPLDSWASMNQTRPAERWPTGYEPQEIAYFCGVLPHDEPDPDWFTDPTFPQRQRQNAEKWLRRHLEKFIPHLWPNAVADGSFLWQLLVDLNDGTGLERLRSQLLIANVDPTERYVLSVPESMEHRLPSDDSRFGNLVLAGDWARNPVNLGCVEAAVGSGMIAARRISGHPTRVIGE